MIAYVLGKAVEKCCKEKVINILGGLFFIISAFTSSSSTSFSLEPSTSNSLEARMLKRKPPSGSSHPCDYHLDHLKK